MLFRSLSEFDINTQNFKTLSLGDVTGVYFNENLYIGKNDEVYLYNDNTKYFEFIYRLPYPDARICSLFKDAYGCFWIGTENEGLFLLDVEKNLTHIVKDANITSIYSDKSGNLWIGNWNHGLFCITPETEIKNFTYNLNKENSISSDFVRSCCEDNSGNIWIGTFQGLDRYDPVTESLDRKSVV